ncbi:MAG: amidohydrolase family protein [Sulfurimonas sp.]
MKQLFNFLIITAVMTGTLYAKSHKYTLVTHAKIFDGTHDTLIEGKSILIKDNLIAKIGTEIKPDANTTVIDAKGHVLMPGLIDAHTHLMVVDDFEKAIYKDDQVYIAALATEAAKRMLLRGFTTVRDAGGPVGGLKRAIDEGIVPGPRILPSNAFISQTGGHGDFNSAKSYLSPHFTGVPDKSDIYGWVKIADGIPEVQKAAREVLRSGATQLKVMASGSITGAHDPIDATEYTYEELKAIVTEAAHWGTYVMVHAYGKKAVQNAIKAGVRSIEHGTMVDPETLKLMKEKGVWLSPQCIASSKSVEEVGLKGTPAEPKFLEVKKHADTIFKLAKKYGLKIAWGTDTFGSLEFQAAQSEEFIARKPYFSNLEILKQVTSENAKLLALCGKRHPYQEGALGVIKEGAYADLIIVKNNPLKDISVLAYPKKNLLLIMKDGKIYKNAL